MQIKQIEELPELERPTGDTLIPASLDGVTYKLSLAQLTGGYDIGSFKDLQRLVRLGLVDKVIAPGDQIEVDISPSASATVGNSHGTPGITAATVNLDVFISAIGTAHAAVYEFTWDGVVWHYGDTAIVLANYGISVTGTAALGDEIAVTVTSTAYDFDVQGLDEDEPANPALEHVLSLQSHKVIRSILFDPSQYLFAVTAAACAHFGWSDTGMPAGTYNITLDHGAYGGGTGQDGTYQFTTSEIVPVGGGVRHTAIGASQSSYSKAQITGGTFTTYGADTVATIESGLAATEGSGGTNLGTATASNPAYRSGDYINFTQRAAYGSSRWSTSFLRQYLNSDDAELVWRPATIWSRNVSTTPEGFLHSVDPELRAALCKVSTRYALPVSDGEGYEDVEDFVKPDTRLDVFGEQNNGVSEGPVDGDGNVTRTTAYSLWKDVGTNAGRKKYLGDNASTWHLASCNTAYASLPRYIQTSGAASPTSGSYASAPRGVAPSLFIG